MARREYKNAIEALKKADHLIPEDPDITFLMGLAFYSLKDTDPSPSSTTSAKAFLRKATAARANGEAFYYLGLLEKDTSDRGALGYLETAAKIGRDEEKAGRTPWWLSDALYRLGESHVAAGNVAAARDAWSQWLVRNPPSDARRKTVENALATSLKGN
jgi:cytochrome c-type biogenesis protein CcmH/NrfG